jgi:hypothetical protein
MRHKQAAIVVDRSQARPWHLEPGRTGLRGAAPPPCSPRTCFSMLAPPMSISSRPAAGGRSNAVNQDSALASPYTHSRPCATWGKEGGREY